MSGQKPLHFLRQTPWWREVESFLESGKDSKALPKTVNSAERDVIRQICKHFDCSFKVKGTGIQRQMYLIKPDFSYFDRVEADQAASQALALHSRGTDEQNDAEAHRKAIATLSATINRLKDMFVDRSFRFGQTQITMARDERKLEIATREADILRKLVAAYEGIVHSVSERFAGAVKEIDMDHINALQNEMSSLRARGRETTQYSLCVRCSRASVTTAVSPCGHVFCTDCAKRVYDDGKCVICRVKTVERAKTMEPSSKLSEDSLLSWQLRQTFLTAAIPFVGFGFLDNSIMLVAGDFIDAKLGAALGITTLAAAALGNSIGDVSGIWLGSTVEAFTHRMGLPDPNLTKAQRMLHSVALTKTAGNVVGVLIGCFLGETSDQNVPSDVAGRLSSVAFTRA
ncbi:hypothetical protein Pmar_PMAR003241 [Perkinsus marinus ATCC 50983]|uniref:RING-type domain-containing protein n=1 Tax=Perkinsus marinus (strain ATCC 50983 / TXsc) TaxID=423536 RepID=C5LKK1_PERM5|nr:hypothetical protein Pmar_PMAR003241 [Perkinsus marinus ATCC 50983]EER02768.1 hypothetical protein Pmar_PMAR003241 [Perkinsus marinus ATCC 50983]|eukprot:XP_002770952.1 hypothetical protein Pmar_PMAR003241 [Perkinsus marinus ATCC 50983]